MRPVDVPARAVLPGRRRPLDAAPRRRRGCDFHARGPLHATGYAHHPYPITEPPGRRAATRLDHPLADGARLGAMLDPAAAAGPAPDRAPVLVHGVRLPDRAARPAPRRLPGASRPRGSAQAETHHLRRSARRRARRQFLLRDDEPRNEYPEGDRAPLGDLPVRPASDRRQPQARLRRLPAAARRATAGRPTADARAVGHRAPGRPRGPSSADRVQRRADGERAWRDGRRARTRRRRTRLLHDDRRPAAARRVPLHCGAARRRRRRCCPIGGPPGPGAVASASRRPCRSGRVRADGPLDGCTAARWLAMVGGAPARDRDCS